MIRGPYVTTTIVAALLSACAGQPPALDRRATPLPDQWHQATSVDRAVPRARDWWRGFGSVELDELIRQAEVQSLDVAAATARVRQAAVVARVSGAALLPEVEGIVEGGRTAPVGDASKALADSEYRAGLAMTYEIDFWGRNRAIRESARRTLQASAFDRDAVRLTVVAGVASLWLQLAALRERIDLAGLNLQAAQHLLSLIESRARAGVASELELAQQRGLVASQRRSVSLLRQQADDTRVAINILLGQATGMELRQASVRGLTVPPVDIALPSELLTRRPDVTRAEAMLAAADADVVAARRAMLPTVTSTAGLSAGGIRMNEILDDPLYSLATALTAPIFNAGRLAAERDLALARREELLAEYRAAIVAACSDVQRALDAIAGLDAQRTDQAEELAQAQRALTLAEIRYRSGAETLQTLLDAQRTLYAAQDEAVQLQSARLQAQVALYEALGGGWSKQ